LRKEIENLDSDALPEYPAAPGPAPARCESAASATDKFPRAGGCFDIVHATTSASQLAQRLGTSLFFRATALAFIKLR
jgi:hypothetical protein